MRRFRARSYGSGGFKREDFASIGENVIIENGALVFEAKHISIGSNVYIGHYAILRGYDRNEMVIGDGVYDTTYDTDDWVVAATADDANEALIITVTGEASKTIRWNVEGSYSEVRF